MENDGKKRSAGGGIFRQDAGTNSHEVADMSFRILGIDPQPFLHLYGMTEADLAVHGVRRYIADGGGFPERVELRDAVPGETLLLMNYVHQPADTPYRASHAIYVREGAREAYDAVDVVPPPLRRRTLSLRAFSKGHDMIDADLVEGIGAEGLIERLFDDPKVAYIQAHYARFGCYAARIERAPA